jgi:glycogen phosphorylase
MGENEIVALRRRLREMAENLWWTWNPDVVEIFRDIDTELWRKSNHNPIVFLSHLSDGDLAFRVEGKAIESRINFQFRRLAEYLHPTQSYGQKHAGTLWREPVAYFCAEFGLHESIPVYCGGLGILAGDHLKSASDLNVPIAGVGLFYSHGYFSQLIDEDGWQRESHAGVAIGTVPFRQVQDHMGRPLVVTVRAGEDEVRLRIWEVKVGRARLFLLDADHEENGLRDREVTRFLYGGGEVMRIRQEIVLGIGGYRALRAMGITPAVLHLNEGHCAFAPLEAVRVRMREQGEDYRSGLDTIKGQTVFTTHTPVAAGHDQFTADVVLGNLGWLRAELGITHEEFLGLGRIDPRNAAEPFCMTVLALKLSRRRNAVSALHGKTSRRMWRALWPHRDEVEVPIGHISNGVHVKSWLAPSMARLYVKHLGKGWETRMSFYEFWQDIDKVSDTELWEEHQVLRHGLIRFIRRRFAVRHPRLQENDPARGATDLLVDGALTIGFSRRFAAYKRATLILSDLDRLDAMVNHPERPAQIVFAGKAHPRDDAGKRLIQEIFRIMRDPRFRSRIVFLEDYDFSVARHLVQGVDLWLNTPERPREACGTSGQKVLLNGGLNCSILDGWWAEAADGLNGFIVGAGREHADPRVQWARDAEALYRVLEEQVIPEFYERNEHDVPVRWVRRMKHAIKTLGWRFNSDRMVKDYLMQLYLPAAGAASCAFPPDGVP